MTQASAPEPGHYSIPYRADIDGLRAIAVLSVVLYHAGVAGLSGGFIGVDVFFVISGYLIGGQIFREARAGTFSFAGFYARRARRILPALFAMLMASLAVGCLFLTPLELRELAKETVPTVFGASNLLFYAGGDYFAPAADFKPLLMTWSLGVEEQFYILFPFVAFGLIRLGQRSAVPALLALSMLAFAGSLVLMVADPQAAFYLLPTRSWELGLGAALALARTPALGRTAVEGMAAIALVVLALAVVLYRPAYPFPGTYALLPVLATAALIAVPDSAVNRHLLSARPMQAIGKISYSLYLWHWPVIYLDRVAGGGGPGIGAVALIVISLGLAVASWRFVEQPLRRRVLPQPTILMRYAAAGVIVAGLGLAIYLANGLPQRLAPSARLLAQQAMAARAEPCLAGYGMADSGNLAACMAPAAGRSRLVVVGDSHASSIAPGFAAYSAARGLAFGQMTKSSCALFDGVGQVLPDRAGHLGECLAFQRAALARIEADASVKVVVLAGFWSGMPDLRRADGQRVPLDRALAEIVGRLRRAGKEVVLVQDVPTLAQDPYARLVGAGLPLRRAAARGSAGTDVPLQDVRPDGSRAMIAATAQAFADVTLVDPYRGLCSGGRCLIGRDDALYYSDFQHLTKPGALAALAPFIATHAAMDATPQR